MGIQVKTTGTSDIIKRIKRLEDGGEKVIQRTVSDFSSRAPGWISKGIRQHYGVDAAAIKEAARRPKRGGTSISVTGKVIDGIVITYVGRRLTLSHFKMSPKQPPGVQNKKGLVPGGAINPIKKVGPYQVAAVSIPKRYKVKATIIKGQRITMSPGTFINSAGGPMLAFQRRGKERTPIEVIKTLSVPQMIDGRAHDTIQEMINTKLGERLENHMKQIMK